MRKKKEEWTKHLQQQQQVKLEQQQQEEAKEEKKQQQLKHLEEYVKKQQFMVGVLLCQVIDFDFFVSYFERQWPGNKFQPS